MGVSKGMGEVCGILKSRGGGFGISRHFGGLEPRFYLWVKRGKDELLELSSGTRCFI